MTKLASRSRTLVLVVSVMLALIPALPSAWAVRPVIGVPVNLVGLSGFPEGIAVGPDGNLYVSLISFSSTSKIVVVSPKGDILRDIPVPAGPGANQTNLLGEIFDREGNLYVCDIGDAFSGGSNGRVLKISPNGSMTTVASGLSVPNGLALDHSGSLYVSDSFQGKIWKVSPAGGVSVFSDSDLLRAHGSIPGVPPAGANGIAFTRADKALLVGNTSDGTLVKIPIKKDGTAGTPSIMSHDVLGADGLALDTRGNIYVTLVPFNRIALLNPSGSLIATIEGTGDNVFRNPASLAFRGRTLYITDLTVFGGGNPGVSVMTARFPGAPLK